MTLVMPITILWGQTCKHVLVSVVRDGEDVWGDLLAFLSSVPDHHLWVVDRQPLVRVHSHTEEPRIGLN